MQHSDQIDPIVLDAVPTLCRDPTQLLWEWNPDRGSVNRDQLLPPELSQRPGYGLTGAANEIP